MQNRTYSVLLGDLTEGAMRRHYINDAIDLKRARRLITAVSVTYFALAAALFIWGVTQ